MFIRGIRSAPALLLSILVFGAAADARGGTDNGSVAADHADIELRKAFRPSRRAGRRPAGSVQRGGEGVAASAADSARDALPQQLESVAEALGEHLQSSGTLHLPDVGGGGVVLQGSQTPILETAAGRQLIIDRGRTIDPKTVEGITRRWPGFSVVQPPAGANLHELIGSLLDASGYDSVLRSAPLIFGRGVTIRLTPDFVVLRDARDLLAGETRALSVVAAGDTLPPELRELAGEMRVLIVELTPEGAPAGVDQAAWRDATGRVTTIETTRLAPIVEEIAVAFGLSVERRTRLPGADGEPVATADLRISRDGKAALVLENGDPLARERGGDAAIVLNSTADLPEAIGELLGRFDIPAIGPAVEFFRAPLPGSPRRFVITAPGWLAESGGRRLLITGTHPPPLVRLYLTREGIDIFEYRIRDGR